MKKALLICVTLCFISTGFGKETIICDKCGQIISGKEHQIIFRDGAGIMADRDINISLCEKDYMILLNYFIKILKERDIDCNRD